MPRIRPGSVSVSSRGLFCLLVIAVAVSNMPSLVCMYGASLNLPRRSVIVISFGAARRIPIAFTPYLRRYYFNWRVFW